jgi:hypothetical protein
VRLRTELTDALTDLFFFEPLDVAFAEHQAEHNGREGRAEGSEGDVLENIEDTELLVERVQEVIEHEKNLAISENECKRMMPSA